ncbi:hypothetical protein BU26DRAFT_62820 [Trematosphaeria pertusa]|uniref:Uncharacterized protein n=1 Tax=Trematosphaeria pertusa TaxID=390896 RepID=A0A6A6I845_9PLEO|nr:uncharacterized protein BU26DRAFT_62820 [Trematosphaeria pertusa]KAF2246132.1 hypothetical protein BU26DRAFT_62820 [Trematosphaeria pertusa]
MVSGTWELRCGPICQNKVGKNCPQQRPSRGLSEVMMPWSHSIFRLRVRDHPNEIHCAGHEYRDGAGYFCPELGSELYTQRPCRSINHLQAQYGSPRSMHSRSIRPPPVVPRRCCSCVRLSTTPSATTTAGFEGAEETPMGRWTLPRYQQA